MAGSLHRAAGVERDGRDRKSVPEMGAEFLREAAVLVAVFVPMDIVLVQRVPLTLEDAVITLAMTAALLVPGMTIERWRP